MDSSVNGGLPTPFLRVSCSQIQIVMSWQVSPHRFDDALTMVLVPFHSWVYRLLGGDERIPQRISLRRFGQALHLRDAAPAAAYPFSYRRYTHYCGHCRLLSLCSLLRKRLVVGIVFWDCQLVAFG
jgi:hypothetical protein